MIRLDKRVVIITGSSQGIGRETARLLAAHGAAVVVNDYRDSEELQETVSLIRNDGGEVTAVVADVTRKDQAQKVVDAALAYDRGISVLINNAGGLVQRVPVAEFDEAHFQTVIDRNLKSTFLMSHLVIPHMKEKRAGKVINLSSQAAHDGGGGGAAAYAASKGAVWTFTKSLAKELAPFGITVNSISPGFIGSTTFHNTFTPKSVHEKMPSLIPLGRVGVPADIAKVALFLASDLSDYMTGQSLQVNGGLYMP